MKRDNQHEDCSPRPDKKQKQMVVSNESQEEDSDKKDPGSYLYLRLDAPKGKAFINVSSGNLHNTVKVFRYNDDGRFILGFVEVTRSVCMNRGLCIPTKMVAHRACFHPLSVKRKQAFANLLLSTLVDQDETKCRCECSGLIEVKLLDKTHQEICEFEIEATHSEETTKSMVRILEIMKHAQVKDYCCRDSASSCTHCEFVDALRCE